MTVPHLPGDGVKARPGTPDHQFDPADVGEAQRCPPPSRQCEARWTASTTAKISARVVRLRPGCGLGPAEQLCQRERYGSAYRRHQDTLHEDDRTRDESPSHASRLQASGLPDAGREAEEPGQEAS